MCIHRERDRGTKTERRRGKEKQNKDISEKSFCCASGSQEKVSGGVDKEDEVIAVLS